MQARLDHIVKLYDILNDKAEREERREAAAARLAHLREVIARLRERNQNLKGKYVNLLDM